MSNIEERVRKLICEQLGVKEEVQSDASLSRILVPIRWIPSNWSWLWKRSLKPKFQTKKPRRLRL